MGTTPEQLRAIMEESVTKSIHKGRQMMMLLDAIDPSLGDDFLKLCRDGFNQLIEERS